MGTDGHGDPDFGPRGYLPERASHRARKIVLRSPMGLQWVVASLVAGVAVLIAGTLFLASRGSPPQAPFVEVGRLDAIGNAATVDLAGEPVLVVTAAGRVRAFADAAGVRYCEAGRQLEAADGQVWTLTGRGTSGIPSLAEHPVVVVDGALYVDPSRTVAGPDPTAEPAMTVCR